MFVHSICISSVFGLKSRKLRKFVDSMKKVMISQSNYVPWKGYFDAINCVDEFIILDSVQYTRRDWRNRNVIKTPSGPQWITIPVEVKDKYFQKIDETKVADKDWGRRHWNAIVHNYSKAKYFKVYKEPFEKLYFDSRRYTYLSDINQLFIEAINELLGIKTVIKRSDSFRPVEGKTERLVDLCKQTGASDYYSGPAAKNYMDEKLFLQEGVAVHYFDYSGYPKYTQLHGDFIHSVSIIDLLFNEGENAQNCMKSFSKCQENLCGET